MDYTGRRKGDSETIPGFFHDAGIPEVTDLVYNGT